MPAPQQKRATLIFDLDGTLIDSATSVLSTLRKIIDDTGIAAAIPVDTHLIGKPLSETIAMTFGTANVDAIDAYCKAFIRHYDDSAYKQIAAYAGIPEVLERLHNAGHSIYLATNKRLIPTQRILFHLGWDRYFKAIETPDKSDTRARNKAEVLANLIKRCNIPSESTTYIGDTEDDGTAAAANSVKFVGVSWGYGDFSNALTPCWKVIDSVDKLEHAIKA